MSYDGDLPGSVARLDSRSLERSLHRARKRG